MKAAAQKRHALRDDQWDKIKDSLPGKKSDSGRTAQDNRLFVDAVLWIGKTGAPWRDLPASYGKWSSVHKRFIRWSKKGLWQMVFNTLAVDADTEWLMIDSSIVRAHQHSAGGKGAPLPQQIGRSSGGFSSKVHASTDSLGCPTKFILTPGNISDCTQAIPLLSGQIADYVLADKGYDSQQIVDTILAMPAQPVIPSRSLRKEPRDYDRHLYKQRSMVECMFAKLKQFRRIATRYDKLASTYMSFLHVAAIWIWLK
ncbi:IS5 family transposase [Pseudodesulfovibrio karagichevae]|uniref:IS5 family transposase n=2 Tax=Pseudodesulfovibrio karagichevae TaxID=3239305 RepID=A0ABV4JX83_9BACT